MEPDQSQKMQSPGEGLRNLRLLTVDQGNSSAKAVVWQGDEPLYHSRIFDISVESLVPLLESGDVESCVYCSVGHNDAKLLESLRRMLDGPLLVLTSSTPLPIEVRYGSRATLGNDRVAAVAGAVSRFPGEPLLVVDAGTAVTIDIVDEKGVFLGGNIAPGLRLRFSSLHTATSALPEIDPEGSLPEFGHDTASAIRSGVVNGIVAEIADSLRRARDIIGCHRIVLTGSDAPLLLPHLERRGLSVSLQPDLVGFGLVSIFRYNLSRGNL